jgi:hypothetical protein
MARQRLDTRSWQDSWPVLLTLPAPDHNLPPLQIDVFHAELEAFLQPESGAVEKSDDNPRHSLQVLHDARDLVPA